MRATDTDRRRRSIRRRTIASPAVVIAAVVAVGTLACSPDAGAQTPRSLVNMIANVNSATDVVFHARATNGLGLDSLSIIDAPRPGEYLGVFDTLGPHARFVTRLATSPNLRTWSAGVVLCTHGSMPTITSVGKGYLLAFESAAPNGNSQIALEHFATVRALERGRPDATRLLRRELSSRNEGTPSIMSVDVVGGLEHSRIEIGFHYLDASGVDRNGVGTLAGFSVWSETPNRQLNQAMEHAGVRGNIGERDAVALDGASVELVEGEQRPFDWSSWSIYAYEPSTGSVTPVPITTPRGSGLSIGLGRGAIVTPSPGRRVLVVTAFVYQEGAAPNARGELIWWRPVH